MYFYIYRKEHAVYWECSVRPKGNRCPASVIERNDVFRRGANEHNHGPKVGAATAIKVQAAVRSKASDDVFKPASAIVHEVVLEQVDGAAPNPALPTVANLVSILI